MIRPAGPLDFLAVDAAIAQYRERAVSPGDPAFEGWLAEFWGRLGEDPPAAYVQGEAVALIDGTIEHRVVLDAAGDRLPELVAELRADPRVRAISLPGSSQPPAGFKPVERWEHRFDLRFAPADPGPPPPGYLVVPWDDARREQAAALLASTNSASVDGLFLTWPDPPTPERCRALIEGLVAGSHGPFSHDTSFLAFRGDRLVALTLMSLLSAEEALLFEIAARFRHRGTGLAPHLLDCLKATLRQRGFHHVRFLACGANAAVLALFKPDEVRSERIGSGWIWLRD